MIGALLALVRPPRRRSTFRLCAACSLRPRRRGDPYCSAACAGDDD